MQTGKDGTGRKKRDGKNKSLQKEYRWMNYEGLFFRAGMVGNHPSNVRSKNLCIAQKIEEITPHGQSAEAEAEASPLRGPPEFFRKIFGMDGPMDGKGKKERLPFSSASGGVCQSPCIPASSRARWCVSQRAPHFSREGAQPFPVLPSLPKQ